MLQRGTGRRSLPERSSKNGFAKMVTCMCVLLAQFEPRQQCARYGGNWVSHSHLPVTLRLHPVNRPPHYSRSSLVGLGTSTQLAQAADSLHTDVYHQREQEEAQGPARVFYAAPGIALYTLQVNRLAVIKKKKKKHDPTARKSKWFTRSCPPHRIVRSDGKYDCAMTALRRRPTGVEEWGCVQLRRPRHQGVDRPL